MSRNTDDRWVIPEERAGQVERGLFVTGAGGPPYRMVLLDAYSNGDRVELYMSADEARRLRAALNDLPLNTGKDGE